MKKTRLLLAFVALAVAVLPGAPAVAMDKHGLECDKRTNLYVNFTGPEWDELYPWVNGGQAKMRDLGQSALANWREAVDGNGNTIFDNSTTWQGDPHAEYSYDWKEGFYVSGIWNVFNGAYAITTCPSEDVHWNIGKLPYLIAHFTPSGMVGLIAHETGHAYGLGHAGVNDSANTLAGRYPIMSTCINNFTGPYASGNNNRDLLIQDDYASANLIDSETDWRAVTANHSFEKTYDRFGNNVEWWQPASAWQPLAGGVNSTPRKARLSGTTMYNRSRVTDTHGNFNGSVSLDDIKASTWVRDSSTNTTGYIELRAAYRLLEYPDGTDSGCNFVDDMRNDPATPSIWYWGPSRFCYPTTTWMKCETVPTEFYDLAGFEEDAADVQVQIWNNTTDASTGALDPVDLDLAWLFYDFDL